MKQILTGFVLAVVTAAVLVVAKVAYDDHMVIRKIQTLAITVGQQNGQPVTVNDVVVAIAAERLQQIQAQQQQKK